MKQSTLKDTMGEGNQIEFIPYSEEDHEELAAMIEGLYREDPVLDLVMTRQKIEATIGELSKRPSKGRIFTFWTRRENSLVGYAIVIFFWSNTMGGDIAIVDELFVKPGWRSRGFSTSFFKYLSTEARSEEGRPFKALQLEVTPANEKAYQLYLRLGFKPAKLRPMFKKLA